MFDEYLKPPPNVDHPVPEVPTLVHAASTSSSSSTTVDQDAPSTSTSQTTSEQQSSVILQGVEDDFYLGLPKDIYTLISHYTDAKDIWDNVKMLLEGSELAKKDQESQLYDDFEHLRQNKGETSHDYYENEVALDVEQLLFIVDGQENDVDKDMDEQPVQALALNVDNIFQEDDCDASDSNVDEDPTAQIMFMANLSSVDPVYDEASPSYDSDILS
nr:integrase, catalytic region, zinc finger, CCHC-type, peptidase aspartic, catalytic [Tanacetum cinerariifolium]